MPERGRTSKNASDAFQGRTRFGVELTEHLPHTPIPSLDSHPMKRALDLLMKTTLGGLLILLPLLLLWLMFGEIFQLLTALARPIADALPQAWVKAVDAPAVMAVALIFVASFALGLSARTQIGQALGRWLERNTVGRLSLYAVLKNISTRLIEIGEGDSHFRPALLDSGNGQRELAYVVEDHGDGFATIMLPRAPTPFSGEIKIVPVTQLVMIDAKLGDLTKVVSQWGMGAHALLARRARS